MTEEKPKSHLSCLVYILLGILGLGILAALIIPPASECAREAARRTVCINNLRNLQIAMMNYEARYGRLPPAYTVDESGKPLHSWRTLLLPFIEREDLYQQIKLDEPWNSPHNLAVYKNQPISIYQCPSHPEIQADLTNYVMVLGPNCVSDGPNSCSIKELPEEGNKTSLLTEAMVPVRWYEPKDLKADEINFKINDETKPGIGSAHPGIVVAAFCSGRTTTIPEDTDPEELRAMFEIKTPEVKKPDAEVDREETETSP